MKVRQVQVQNYRSIVDSGVVDLEDRVTVLIGKNEQGKTNFLKAIASFNPKRSYTPNDLPNHLRPTLEERNPADIPIVTLWLEPEYADKPVLKDVISNVDEIQEFKITRFYDGHYAYCAVQSGGTDSPIPFASVDTASSVDAIKGYAEDLKAKLNTHASRVPAFAASLTQAQTHIDQFVRSNFQDVAQIDNLIQTFSVALKGLPGQDEAIQTDIALATKEIQGKHEAIRQALHSDPIRVFERQIPHFIFHSTTLDRIPNEVNVYDFIRDAESTSRGMANLCKVAGLSIQKIQELAAATDTSRREAYEDHYRATISGGLNEFWTQESYNVHFRIEKEKLSVSISDSTYSPRIAPSDRSDGFQWYLSFYSALLSEVSATDATILLLDNPGLELHSDGQRDIKRFLEVKLPPPTQIIYVTHSPAMIDPYNLEQLRQVELKGDMQGTKVGRLALKEGEDFDLLEPVRSAIGASLVSSLVMNEFNVLVEGSADKPILEGAFGIFYKDASRKILVNGSVAETREGFLVRFYQRAGLPFAVYLDADSRGRELSGALKRWGIENNKIVCADEHFPNRKGNDFELEDLISVELYHRAVSETYPNYQVAPPDQGVGKRTKHYEKVFKESHGIGFNKRRVAERLKKLLLEGNADEKTVDSLKKVADAIWNALQKQVDRTGS